MIVQVRLFCGQCIWRCLFNVICFLVVWNPITIDVSMFINATGQQGECLVALRYSQYLYSRNMNRVVLLLDVVMWQSSLYTYVWSGQLNFIPRMPGEPAWKHLPSASVFVYQLCHCSGCFNVSCLCWFMSWENWESGSYSLCSWFGRFCLLLSFWHLLSFCTFCPMNLWGTWETFHVWSVALARNVTMKYESCSRDT